MQRQEVDAALERRDPPVQQRDGRAFLPAKVVDNQHAAIGGELQRRLVDMRGRAIREVKMRQLQLAADHDHRPAAPDPPLIFRDGAAVQGIGHRITGHRVVSGRVEDPDDVAVSFYGVGDRDVTIEQFTNRLRDDRLSVSRRPIDEHGMRAIDGRPKLIEHALAEHQTPEGAANAFTRRGSRRRFRKRMHVGAVRCKRHRRGSEILALLHEGGRAFAARLSDAIDKGRTCGQTAARHLHEMRQLHPIQDRVDDRVAQPEFRGELRAAQFTRHMQPLQCQLMQGIKGHSAILERRGGLRKRNDGNTVYWRGCEHDASPGCVA